ncbi:HAD-IIIC family phosphatase, partial [Amycolatopsis sp. NPDC049252]|uniref:HAD-IIIC family phosphatase n=1 Tax=Amycolatopsis sp. NPDC049252 TaxID=3363933 RepID=UPI00371E1BC9
GQLAVRWPEVRKFLCGLSTEDLERAGRLLARVSPADVLAAHPDVPVVRVAITGHGTVSPVVPPLAAELARHGLLLDAHVCAFDSYVFDLTDPASDLYAHRPDLVLCPLDPEIVTDELPVPWRAADAETVLDAKIGLLEDLARRHAAQGGGVLVFTTLPLPGAIAGQLVDQRSRARLGAAWRRANARLLDLTAELASVSVIDVDPLLAEGIPAEDARLGRYTKTHLSPALLTRLAREAGHLARYVTGSVKKCLAVDLDETLWGGVLGDDGLEGIEVGDTPRGEAFRSFQRVVKQLGSQGVLVAAVSKNDGDLVHRAFAEHPGMLLRKDDFVRVVANWQPKHDNLAALAADLNIAADATVFADDSSFECGLVRHELPGVAVVQLDDEPALHGEKLFADNWFTVRELTATDRQRPSMYRQELRRRDFLDSFDSLADYLAGLGVVVELAPVTAKDVPRISQITLRTNQFNLTTVRLQQDEVQRRAADPEQVTLAIRSSDRFGDNGTVGAIFLRRGGSTLHIDNFLLSCRVFSRGVEDTCLAAVLAHAAATGATAVSGTYRPSPKNGKVAGFYLRHGFTAAGETGGAQVFTHDLTELPAPPGHVRLVDRLAEGRA